MKPKFRSLGSGAECPRDENFVRVYFWSKDRRLAKQPGFFAITKESYGEM